MRAWNLYRPISTLSLPQLNTLLQQCSKSRALNPGKQTHQQTIIHGLYQNPFITTKLIQMYADFNDHKTAYTLFAKLPQPNIFAFTAILSYHSHNGNFNACFTTYHDMKLAGISPDHYVFPKVLKACVVSKNLQMGKQVHKDVIVSGTINNSQVCNSLIDMYSKCGDIECSKRIFDCMEERDLLSWNIMISGYVHNKILDFPVEEILSSMKMDNIEPDIITFNTIMDSYCRMGKCDEAWNVFNKINKPNVISWTILISGFSRIKKHEASLEIFKQMMSRKEGYTDIDCLASVLSSCQHMNALKQAREIHAYGIKLNEFYKSAGPALLATYAKCRQIQKARFVFNFMDKFDVVTWNAMILGYSDLGMGNLAIECFKNMRKFGVISDQTTISTLLPVCDLKCGKQIHACIIKTRFVLLIPVLNALIHMYAKCGNLDDAYSIFSGMKGQDLVSWNTMIRGFGIHGLGEKALGLLKEMISLGISPNNVTLTSILSGCSHSGLVDEGVEAFYTIPRDYDFSPGMEHYSCVVDLLARAGRIEEAVEFIEKMDVKPDKRIWGCVLSACREYGNVRIGMIASKCLMEMESENAGHFVTVSDMYARVGRVEDMFAVREEMENRGVVKESGFSQVEIGN